MTTETIKYAGWFKVLRGVHEEKDENGVRQRYKKGSVVHSRSNLLKLNGRTPGTIKFQKVDGPQAADPTEEEYSRKDLESLTVEELRELAETNEVDLGSLKKKDEIISCLLGEEVAA